jgi:hypothetical protein
MHVRVKFFDGRRDARDTAGHPFEGQPHSGFRRAKCPHLVDIREGQAARSRTDLPGSDDGQVLLAADARVTPALPTGSAPSSEAHTNCQQRFVLPARRYEARSLSVAERERHVGPALAHSRRPDELHRGSGRHATDGLALATNVTARPVQRSRSRVVEQVLLRDPAERRQSVSGGRIRLGVYVAKSDSRSASALQLRARSMPTAASGDG